MINNATEFNKYEPTPAEKKTLKVLINLENYAMSIADRCCIAELQSLWVAKIIQK